MDNINEKIQKFVKKENKKNKEKYGQPPKICETKTAEELIAILKRIGGEERLTEAKYRELRLEDDPNPLTYYRRFGSWNNACEMTWGKKPLTPKDILKEKSDESYLVNLINEFKINNKEKYILKRKEHPDIFPSIRIVEKLFKNFTNLFKAAEHFSLNDQLMLCLEIRLKLKKCPSLDDYKKEGVNVDLLLRKYFTQKKINSLVRLLEEAYERKRGSQSKDAEFNGTLSEREKKKEFKPFTEQLRV